MPATGLKIVGTGACLPWRSISSSFQNSSKKSGHRDYEFLEFWCWNLVPFLPDIGLQLLKSSWSSLTYFSFNDAPNVLYRWKIWTAGRPNQHLDSSTTKPCCCNSCSIVVLHCPAEIHKAFPETDVIWKGAYVALKPLYTPFSIHSAFQNMQAAHTVCTYAPHTIRDAAFETERW